MLGAFDDRRSYALPKDLAEILIKMPKTPVVSEDEIDVGTNVAFLKGELGTEFCLEDSILYLVERAEEMGGVLVHTYLTPLTEITLDYFKNLDAHVDLTPLKERVRTRRAQYEKVLAEHERLARGAIKKLAPPNVGEYKRFIRPGKPDFYSAQLQLLEHTGGENEIITRWKTACNNKAVAALLAEPPVILSDVKDLPAPTGNRKGGKRIDFKTLLAAMLKQNPPRKLRLKPSEKVANILTAEDEIQEEFEPGLLHAARNDVADEDEKKLPQLVTTLLETKETKKTARPSLAGKQRDPQSQRAPEPSNHDLER